MLGALGAGRRAAAAPPTPTLTSVAAPRPGVVSVTTYDADGRPVSTREEFVPRPAPVFFFTYDERGRLLGSGTRD
jgi:hypothetical protein